MERRRRRDGSAVAKGWRAAAGWICGGEGMEGGGEGIWCASRACDWSLEGRRPRSCDSFSGFFLQVFFIAG